MRIQSQEFSDRVILSIVGAIQGLVIWLLLEMQDQNLTTAMFAAILTFILVSGAIIHFVWTGKQNIRLMALAAMVAIVYAAIAFWVSLQLPDSTDRSISPQGDEIRIATWTSASLFSLYVLGPFLQIYQRTSKARFPYPDLFVYSWSNFHIALVGLLFLAVLWAVLGLWAALFRLLDISFFAGLFSQEVFMWTVSGGAIGFGLSLGRENEKLISTLRNITMSVFRALLPLVALVALMFLIAVPFTGLNTLWDTRRASWILLSWVAFTVLYINAVYQDGTEPEPYTRPLRIIVEGGLLAMTFFCGFALYGLFLRVDQYGLTPSRFMGLIWTAIFIVYVVGYSVSVVRRRPQWLDSIRTVNLWMAPVLVSAALLVHTPILDPLNWSARNQYNRLAGGKADADDFDYQYLRFKLGRAGQRQFEKLKTLSGHQQTEQILAGIAGAEQAQSYQRHLAKKPTEQDFLLYPEGAEWPPGLLTTIRNTAPNMLILKNSRKAQSTVVIAVEIDAVPGAEYVVFPAFNRYAGTAFKSDDTGGWQRFGTYRTVLGAQNLNDFDKAVSAGKFAAAPPEYPNLIINEQRFYLAP